MHRRIRVALESEQYERLSRLAAHSHRSVSDVAREMIAEGLDRAAMRKELALGAMSELAALRDEVKTRFGPVVFDPVDEARADRQRETVK